MEIALSPVSARVQVESQPQDMGMGEASLQGTKRALVTAFSGWNGARNIFGQAVQLS